VPAPLIRLATVHDAAAIAELSRRAIEQGLGWSWQPARVLAAIRDRATNVAVIDGAEAIVGFGIMLYREEAAHLTLLAVDEGHRGQGLGQALVTWLEQPARVAGAVRIRVEARADNPRAIAFYERLGFRLLRTVPGYYSGLVDAVQLHKALAPPSRR
jgi:ribosomal-protein-alanine N-acetyltransferase